MKTLRHILKTPPAIIIATTLATLAGCGMIVSTGVSEVAGASRMAALSTSDSNGDAMITLAELTRARRQAFTTYDPNGDDLIDLAEYQQMQQTIGPRQQSGRKEHSLVMREPLELADGNGNGSLDAQEFASGAARLLVLLDSNGDGAISRSDFSRLRR